MRFYSDFELTLSAVKTSFSDCSDFLMREFTLNSRRAFFCVMDGLADMLQLGENVIEPLLENKYVCSDGEKQMEYIEKNVIRSPEISRAQTFEDAEFYLMSGFFVLFLDGCSYALAVGVQGWNRRTTDEPTNESAIKGAKECFVETLNDNKALLRKRLKTSDFKMKQIKTGKTASTPIVIAYLKSAADGKTVAKIENTIKNVPLEIAEDYGSIAAFIDGKPASFFSCVGNTERPDVLVSKLLEGRVAVLVEGTPFVMYTPYLFTDNFSSLDDYNNPAFYSTFVRLLKYFSFALSVFLPALYVAVGTYHQEVIPATLLYIIASSEDTTPLPLLWEAVIIHILYEIMREAGLRLPKTVGHAVSIIGAIVIGEAMVSAGFIGEPMLVIVALTAISSYAVYPLYERIAVLRLVLIVVAGLTGVFGMTVAFCALCSNICALGSFGVPYSAPLSPLYPKALGDTLIHRGWKKLAGRVVRIGSGRGNSE